MSRTAARSLDTGRFEGTFDVPSRRPAIDQDRVGVRRTDQDRVTLADIEYLHPRSTRRAAVRESVAADPSAGQEQDETAGPGPPRPAASAPGRTGTRLARRQARRPARARSRRRSATVDQARGSTGCRSSTSSHGPVRAGRTTRRPGRSRPGRPSPARLNGNCQQLADLPERRPRSFPSHIAGATAGMASRLAATVPTGSCSKWKANSGAVEMVAARVTAVPSARACPPACGTNQRLEPRLERAGRAA